MKKLLTLLSILIVITGLTACTSDPEPVSLKIMAPIGTPALTQTYMQSTMPSLGDYVSYEIETVSGTDPLVAAFGSGSHDIIFAPTNLGAKLISTGLDYQFAGAVVWGNLYLASSGYDQLELSDLDGKEIVAFGQNATPDIILNEILNGATFETAPTIRYVDSVSQAQAELILDNTRIVLLAEPALSALGLPNNLGDELDVLDLQDEWESLTGDSSYPQAGVFVKSDLDSDVVEAYLSELENSIEMANSDPALIAGMAIELDYGFPETVLISAIPRANLEFRSASESRTALEIYFNRILDVNPVLIGGALPEDSFYFGLTTNVE